MMKQVQEKDLTKEQIKEIQKQLYLGKQVLIEQNKKVLNNKEIIFIGKTGCGKTTLCNFLVGNPLKVEMNRFSYLKIIGGEGIGSDLNSQTILPGLFIDKIHSNFFADFPGFGDNRGAAQDIINSFYAKEMFNTNFQKKSCPRNKLSRFI